MAAVSIQSPPRSTAWRMAAIELASSCGPQPNAQPPPPIAQAPKPTVVISRPLEPRGRVGNLATFAALAALPPEIPDFIAIACSLFESFLFCPAASGGVTLPVGSSQPLIDSLTLGV